MDNPFTPTRLASMACPALPTCGLALAESERILPDMLTCLEQLLAETGLLEVILPERQKTLVVPGTAVSYAPFGDSVFVIEKKKDEQTGKESQTIRQQFVRIGEARGDFVSITEGLKGNETIVGTGVFKLRNGMSVVINNDLAPKPQLNPKPVDS